MYDVYGFKSLSILNIAGMTHPQHDGTPYGCLQDVLDKVFPKSDWRGKYTTCNRGLSYRAGLRRMLAELIGVRYWLEFGFGTSWQQYRSLDAYVSIFHHGMSPPPSEAWFLLNTEVAPYDRKLYPAEQWYHCRDWKSIGQRASMTEWEVSATAAIALRDGVRSRL